METNLLNKDLEKELISNDIALAFFHATWCNPCKMMHPIVSKIEQEYKNKIKFYTIDVDKNKELTTKYQILSVPCFKVLKKGKVVKTFSGYISEEQFKNELNSIL